MLKPPKFKKNGFFSNMKAIPDDNHSFDTKAIYDIYLMPMTNENNFKIIQKYSIQNIFVKNFKF